VLVVNLDAIQSCFQSLLPKPDATAPDFLADPSIFAEATGHLGRLRAKDRLSWSSLRTFWPPRLVDAARANKLAVFFGAGVSIASGAPSWGSLLRDFFQLESNLIDDDDLRRDPLTLAEIAASRLGIETVQATLQSVYARLEKPSTSHCFLAALKAPIYVTTNYDGLFEIAFKKFFQSTSQHELVKVVVPSDLLDIRDRLSSVTSPEILSKIPTSCETPDDAKKLLEALEENNKRFDDGSSGLWLSILIKMHGCVSHGAGGLILTRSEYRRHYRENQLLFDFVRHVLGTHHTLFCGFSHADPEVSRLVEDVIHAYEAQLSSRKNRSKRVISRNSRPHFYSLQFEMSTHTPEVFAARGLVALSSPPPLSPTNDVRSAGFNTAICDLLGTIDQRFKEDFSLHKQTEGLQEFINTRIDGALRLLGTGTEEYISVLNKPKSDAFEFQKIATKLFELGLGTQGVYICNANGKMLKHAFPEGLNIGERVEKIESLPNGFGDRPYMQQARIHQDAFVSDLFVSIFNRACTFMLIHPVLYNGQFRGVVLAASQVGQWKIEDKLRANLDSPYGIYLVDGNGICLFPPYRELQMKKLVDDLNPQESDTYVGYDYAELLSLSRRDKVVTRIMENVLPIGLDDDVLRLDSELHIHSVIANLHGSRWKLATTFPVALSASQKGRAR
jgi:hypothetical protein